MGKVNRSLTKSRAIGETLEGKSIKPTKMSGFGFEMLRECGLWRTGREEGCVLAGG